MLVIESRGFTEKPDTQTAVNFIRSGEYSWNSGMFIWRADRALREFAQHLPEIYAGMMQLQPAIDTPDYEARLARNVGANPEGADRRGADGEDERIAVIPVDIGWSDVGSWEALFDVLDLDTDGNGFKGSSPNRLVIDTKNTLVYSDKLTVTIGVEDFVIVDTQDVLMICKKDRDAGCQESR